MIVLPGIAVAVLSTALPYLLDMVALTRLPTRTFGVLMSIEPAIGALTGLLFLDEKLSVSQWAAITLIILASVGVTAGGAQKMTARSPSGGSRRTEIRALLNNRRAKLDPHRRR